MGALPVFLRVRRFARCGQKASASKTLCVKLTSSREEAGLLLGDSRVLMVKLRAPAGEVHFHSHNFDVTLSFASVLCSNTPTMPARFANLPVAVKK
jgi:hypothetical protein